MWSCRECPRVFDKKVSLSLHMRSHRNEVKFSCDFCPQCFRTKTTRDNHVCFGQNKRIATVGADDRARLDRLMAQGIPAILVELATLAQLETLPPRALPVQVMPPAVRSFDDYLMEAVFVK